MRCGGRNHHAGGCGSRTTIARPAAGRVPPQRPVSFSRMILAVFACPFLQANSPTTVTQQAPPAAVLAAMRRHALALAALLLAGASSAGNGLQRAWKREQTYEAACRQCAAGGRGVYAVPASPGSQASRWRQMLAVTSPGPTKRCPTPNFCLFLPHYQTHAARHPLIAAAAYSCDAATCTPPACMCPSTQTPGGLSLADTPQFVLITVRQGSNGGRTRRVNRVLFKSWAATERSRCMHLPLPSRQTGCRLCAPLLAAPLGAYGLPPCRLSPPRAVIPPDGAFSPQLPTLPPNTPNTPLPLHPPLWALACLPACSTTTAWARCRTVWCAPSPTASRTPTAATSPPPGEKEGRGVAGRQAAGSGWTDGRAGRQTDRYQGPHPWDMLPLVDHHAPHLPGDRPPITLSRLLLSTQTCCPASPHPHPPPILRVCPQG